MKQKKWYYLLGGIILAVMVAVVIPTLDFNRAEAQTQETSEAMNIQGKDSTEITSLTDTTKGEETNQEVFAKDSEMSILQSEDAYDVDRNDTVLENTEEVEYTRLSIENIWAQTYHSLMYEDEISNETLIKMALAGAENREIELLSISGDHLVTYQGKRFTITNDDYQVLLRIVESEAPAEDLKGKMLVANVVMNRVLSDWFPDTIGEVVFEKRQFAPVTTGYYWMVEITDSTREAVERVLAGEDESQGALFFMARALANPKNVKWFDTALEYLFTHGGHEFFKAKSK